MLLAAAGAPARAADPSVAQLLTLHDAAVHRAPPAGSLPTAEVSGTLRGQGLSGTFHSWRDGTRTRNDQQFGPRFESTIAQGGRVIFSDENGNVREFRGVYLRRERTAEFVNSGDFIDHPEAVRWLGARRIGAFDTYEIEVRAVNGEPERLYIDRQTYLIDRLEYASGDGDETVDFSDYREIDGAMFAFKAIASNGDREFDIEQRVAGVRLGGPIPAQTFAEPKQRPIDLAQPVEVPLEERSNHFYAQVEISGRHYSFLVDTGAQNVVIDARVARELALHQEGALQVAGATRAGGLRLARLPGLAIGSAQLHELVVTTIDLAGSTAGAFKIDGILGYPFFAAAAVRIDPARKVMTIAQTGTLAPLGTKIDMEMDRAFPEIDALIDGQLHASFIVDTGSAAEVLLYRPFVDAHAGIVPITFNARSTYGVGGSTQSYRTVLGSLAIAGVTLYNRFTDVMLGRRGAFADRFDAGNIGFGTLRNFIVTFDASANALYLAKAPDFSDGRERSNAR